MKEKKSFLDRPSVQAVLAALICIVLGVLIGFIVLLLINPSEAFKGICSILKNYNGKDLCEVFWKYTC